MDNRKKFYALAVFLFLVTVLVYSTHFDNDFHFDDSHTIVNNSYLRSLDNVPLFFKDGATISSLPTNQSYRPLLATFFAFNYWLAGDMDVHYFHFSIFLFYLLQCVMMYFLFLKIINKTIDNRWNNYFALFATAWYALHTANAETINYICAASDSLSTFFLVLALVLYGYFPEARKWHIYLIPVLAGLLIKQTLIVFPVILFLYILFFEQEAGFGQLLKKENVGKLKAALIGILPSAVLCAIMYFVLMKMNSPTLNVGGDTPVYQYLITQAFVVLHYFLTFFFPVSLSADTDWQLLNSIVDIRFFVGFISILILIILGFMGAAKRETRPASFGLFFFFVALAPTSSFIPLAEVLNDHRIFFPYVGLALSVSSLIYYFVFIKYQSVIEKHSIVKAFSLFGIFLLLEIYALGTYERNEVWDTEETLWHDVTIKSPKNGRGMMNYGLTLMNKGDYANAGLYFEKAKEIYPYYSYIYINYAILKEVQGDFVSAEENFKYAVELDSENPETNFYYGRFLNNQSRLQEALPYLQKTMRVSPAHTYAMNLAMDIYSRNNNCEELTKVAKQMLSIIPDHKAAINYLKNCEGRMK